MAQAGSGPAVDVRGQTLGSALLERAYAYDTAGQLVVRADSLRGRQDFRYDPTGRILAAIPGALQGGRTPGSYNAELFAFDPAGNLLPESSTSPGRTGEGVIFDNRLRFYQDLHFEYDVHGNVIRRTRGNQKAGHQEVVELRWNADHQLIESTSTRHGVSQTTRYAYDALGRRVSKSDAFGSTCYLWDGDLMIHSQRGVKQALYVYETDSFIPLATVQGAANDAASEQTYWYQCDQIGSPQELTDERGHIAWAADYKVWGEAKLRKLDWPRTGTDGGPARGSSAWPVGASGSSSPCDAAASPLVEQPFRFQGQQFDEETGLHYNRFRYFDPAVGRFVSQDPIGLYGDINLFAFATNTTNWVDPLGLNPSCPAVPKKEIEIEAKSYEEARNIALEKMGSIDPSTRAPQTGRLGAGKGRRTGFTGMGKDGEFKRMRLDYDPTKGPHINVEVGKGACAKKWAIKFRGNEKTFEKLLKRNT
ncbi:RHS domain-containing protein [Acidovorax sp. LjRoot129]|uniref:RHS repeat-associated core domain-containing protein n=1 Tax=Acidovorax sp. LjRoot129 TaxID=3342260 RepID=UPI003ECE5F5E